MASGDVYLPGELPWRDIKEPEWRAVLASTAALARSDSEDQLLREVCVAAVDAGGYLLAWYGRLVANGEFHVHSVASAGPSTYLNDFVIGWAHDVTAPSPGGMAVNAQHPVFTRDIKTDPAFAPWRDRAVQHGICSLVSIPVFVSGELDGVLSIYSNHLGQFDEVATSVLTTLCQQVGIGMERLRAASRINDALESTIRVLSAALEARDPYTAGHESSVAAMAERIAVTLGLDDFQCQGIRLAALVHDIGKIGVPTELLTKPTVLRDAEMALIREHVAIGEEVLGSIDFPWPITSSVAEHHERLDGSGYPRGLKGKEISLAGQILAVADVLDAMSRPRPYREHSSIEEAVAYLESERDTLFDRTVVDACARLVRAGEFRADPDKS